MDRQTTDKKWPLITKTCLYNFDPLKPHFYTAKLGFTGVYIIFLISAQNIDCGYSLEPPQQGRSNEYLQSMFWAEVWKISEFFYLKSFSFWGWNFQYIWIGVFVMIAHPEHSSGELKTYLFITVSLCCCLFIFYQPIIISSIWKKNNLQYAQG